MYYDGLCCTLIWHSLCRHSKEISRLLQEPSVDSNYYERMLFAGTGAPRNRQVYGVKIYMMNDAPLSQITAWSIVLTEVDCL